jgi:glutamate synthase domain-containing protein 3
MRITANGLHYKELNEKIFEAVQNGEKEFVLDDVNGQRFIADGLKGNIKINVFGVPGNDLGMFMDGPTITVHGNAQDGVGNTMSSGKIIIHGDGRDILGHSMRGGTIFVKGDVGYRVGIHMKTYKSSVPVIVAGGRAGDFLGEYMAGGIIIILGINSDAELETLGEWIGTGQHGGAIYVRGKIDESKLGNGTSLFQMTKDDEMLVTTVLTDYCYTFNLDINEILRTTFTKIAPLSHRPYAALYSCD